MPIAGSGWLMGMGPPLRLDGDELVAEVTGYGRAHERRAEASQQPGEVAVYAHGCAVGVQADGVGVLPGVEEPDAEARLQVAGRGQRGYRDREGTPVDLQRNIRSLDERSTEYLGPADSVGVRCAGGVVYDGLPCSFRFAATAISSLMRMACHSRRGRIFWARLLGESMRRWQIRGVYSLEREVWFGTHL